MAPTLSILAGVSPFYASLALPAFDLLDIDSEYNASLLSAFRQIIGDRSDSLLISELRGKRDTLMQMSVSPSALVISAILIGLSLFLLLHLILTDIHQGSGWGKRLGTSLPFSRCSLYPSMAPHICVYIISLRST